MPKVKARKAKKASSKARTKATKGSTAGTGSSVAPTGTDWFVKGDKGFAIKKQIDAATKIRREKSAPRFMMKAEEEAIIVFVDNIPFFIYEHNISVQGKWGNYLTCTKEIRSCTVCDSGLKSTYSAYFTVIDRREFVRKADGKIVKDRKVLYPAKGSTIARIEDLRKEHGNLHGCMFRVKRYTRDDPNCGTDFKFLKKVRLAGDKAKPYDYNKVLYPPTTAELGALGFTDTVAGRQVEEQQKTNKQVEALDEIL